MKALCSLLGLLLLLPGTLPAQDAYEVVLRVNDRIATTWDYQRRRADKIRVIQGAESLSSQQRQRMLANVGVSTMDDIFEELLMLSRADQLGIRVNDQEIDRAMATTMQNYGMESEEQFEQALRSSNMTIEQFRDNMSRSMLVQRLMSEEVHPRISLEEEDLRRFYQNHLEEFQEPERLRLEEVVILSASDLSAEQRAAVAEDIRRQVADGGELQTVVEPFVARGETSSAVDLGWVEVGDLDPELEKAAWGLEAGAVSEAVEGRGGLHVLVVTERQEARLKPFAEVEDQIRATEGERLLSAEMQEYLEELEAAAYVLVNAPADAIGFRASLQMASDTDELEMALTAPLVTAEPESTADESTADEPTAATDATSSDPSADAPAEQTFDLLPEPRSTKTQDDSDDPPLDGDPIPR